MPENSASANARHEAMVRRAGLFACQLVSPDRPLPKLTRAELDEISKILIDAAIIVAAMDDKAPGSRSIGQLTLAAEDGELTREGQAIVDKRAADRERRRQRRAEHVS